MSDRHRVLRAAYVIELTSFRPVDILAVVAALPNSKKPIRMICLQKADAQVATPEIVEHGHQYY